MNSPTDQPSRSSDLSSHQYLQALVEQSNALFFVKNSIGQYLFCNQATADFLQKPIDQILGKDDEQLLGEENAKWLMHQEERVLKRGQPQTEDHALLIQGTVRILRVTKLPYFKSKGELCGILGYANEISDSCFDEPFGFRTSSVGLDYFQNLVVRLSQRFRMDYVLIGKLSASDQEIETLATCHRGELIGNLTYSLKDSPCEQVMARGFCYYPQNVQNQFPKDLLLSQFALESYMGMPLLSREGKAIGILVMLDTHVIDIASPIRCALETVRLRASEELERLLAEERLRENEERYRVLLESLPNAVLVHDGSQILYANKTALELLQVHDVLQASQKNIQQWFPSLADQLDYVPSLFSDQVGHDVIETCFMQSEGVEKHLEIVSLNTFYQGKKAVQWVISDVTSRRNAERHSRDSMAQLHSIYEAVHDVLFLIDVVGPDCYQFRSINSAFCKITGVPKQAIVGKRIEEVIPEPSLSLVRSKYQTCIESKSSVTWEETTRYPTGVLTGEVCIVPILDADGTCSHLVGSVRDITDRKAAEKTIQQLNAFHQTVIETAAEGICVAHPISQYPYIQFTTWNQRMEQITGYSMSEVNAGGWHQTFYPEESQRAMASDRVDRMFRGVQLNNEEWEFVHKSGERKTVAISTSSIDFKDGRFGTVALVQDITQRRRAEKRLRASEARYKQLFENSPNAIIELSSDLQIVAANYQAAQVFPECSSLPQSVSLIDCISPEDRTSTTHWLGTSHDHATHLHVFQTLHGNILSAKLIPLPNGNQMVSFQDITQSKLAADELQRSEHRFSKLFDASPFSIIVATYPSGKVIEANDAFLQIFGFTRDEVIGRTTGELGIWVDSEDRIEMIQRLKDSDSARNMEIPFRTKRGEVRTLLMSVEIIDLHGQAHSLAMSIDITERNRAESEWRKTADLLHAVVAGTTDSVFIKDRNGKYLLINDAGSRFTNRTPEEILGNDDSHIFDTETAFRLTCQDREVMNTGKNQTYQNALVLDGKEYFGLTTKSPYYDSSGKIIGIIGISRDITAIKERERELLLTQFSIERAVDSVFWISPEGVILYVNEAACKTLEYDREEMIGKHVAEIDANFPREHWESHWNEIKLRGSFTLESEHQTKSGRCIQTEVTVNYLQHDGREYNCAVMRDITQRKLGELALRKSLAQLQATLDATADGILAVDLHGKMLGFNEKFRELWGLPTTSDTEEPCYQSIMDLSDEENLRWMLDSLKDPKQVFETTRRIEQNPHNSSFDTLEFLDGRVVERVSQPQCIGGVPVGRVWSFHNVTEQRRLETQLRQSQKMEAIGQLAGGIAHDFNNILTVINGYCELMLLNSSLNPQSLDVIREIRDSGKRATHLTEQLLAFSRRSVSKPITVSLNSIVTASDRFLRRLIGEQIDLQLQLDPKVGSIQVDPHQLDQVLMNLAVNARDAMPEGGKLVLQTSLVLEPADPCLSPNPLGYAQLSVTDTGIGIPEELRSRIFEPFFTTKETGKGSGLGLAVVHGIVQQNGAKISVESVPGVGTTFHILFPIVHSTQPTSPEKTSPIPPRGSETILLVEDEQGVRKIAKLALESQGYQVMEAANGNEALRLMDQIHQSVDMLVTDMVMPGIHGRDLADTLRKDHPHTPILYMSGYHDDERVRTASLESTESFLPKPFTPNELIDRVRTQLMRAKNRPHRP